MLVKVLLFFIALYRKTTVFSAKNCRYYPTCSDYFEQALKKYGFSGFFLGIMRILRCNQFFKGGYDPLK